MLVLHGFWSAADGLCLWAEDSQRTVKSRSQALRSARPHPFSAPASTLAGIHTGKPGEVTLLLPSLRSAPLDSPELIRVTPRPPAKTKPALLPWTVPVVALDASAALTALSERAAEIRYGASIDYLGELAAYASELAARGHVLPTLDDTGAGAVARWRPVLRGPDVVAMHALVRAMPPVCRAVPGRDDPHELVFAALRALVDASARAALADGGANLPPPRRGRQPKRPSAAEAWLAALTSPDGRFDGDPGDIDALARTLRPWDDIGTGKAGPARATLRLAEILDDQRPGDAFPDEADLADPDPGGSRWRLEFLLQSVHDPSLLVPAEQVWTDDGSLGRWLPQPQDLLLAELGRASRPPMPRRPATSANWPTLTGSVSCSTRRKPSRTACPGRRRQRSGRVRSTGSR